MRIKKNVVWVLSVIALATSNVINMATIKMQRETIESLSSRCSLNARLLESFRDTLDSYPFSSGLSTYIYSRYDVSVCNELVTWADCDLLADKSDCLKLVYNVPLKPDAVGGWDCAHLDGGE